MFELIFLLVIYIVIKNSLKNHNTTMMSSKLNTLFKIQNFSNISKNLSIPDITLISADSDGENNLFALKNTNSLFSLSDINNVYEYAQNEHIHNVILITPFSSFSTNILKQIKEYDIQVWDYNKLNSLIYSTNNTSILKTSNTSDDTCKIDNNQFNPIQEPTSFFKNILKKPDRL